ncbi:MAG TPA: beta-L-arabinofuranosidase domain-containing protein [Chitinophagaceae bacterium]|nr:beta-L-arabinofuranosidase domain-containing protein [Chitinophagaceae bacterium]
MKNKASLRFAFCILNFAFGREAISQRIQPIDFSHVTITDEFWKPKIDKVGTKTLAACIYQTEVATPRIRNFEKVARKKGERHEGIYYDDSDVYKALEAMGYSLKNNRDSVMEAKADEWIDKVAAAQQPDGYLNTYFTLNFPEKRWTDIEKHEDYNAGHLIEAAVAYYNATGKRKLLDVAIRLADHIDTTFRLANRKWFSGHQEIELALMKLYHLTKNDRYLKLADWYLQQRGKGYYSYGKNWIKPEYWQDQVDVKDEKEITGHAVRAMYLYSGAADVAAVTGDEMYVAAMKRVWEDVVYRNMYVTGGIGSSGDNEGFSTDYDLPNELAYCETCASVGMVLWNVRMNSLSGDSKYIDVLERSLYNGALDGLSLSGDRFFYDNVLASNGGHQRRGWFGTACCPANIARLVASVGNYIYAKSNDGLWVNLFVQSNTNAKIGNANVNVSMKSNYPWGGNVEIKVDPDRKSKFTLHVRIPGWAVDQMVPGDLYKTETSANSKFEVTINGKSTAWKNENGYAVVEREWKKGDVMNVMIPMEVKKLVSRTELKANEDRVAIQRGPLVYCIEGADNKGDVWNLLLEENSVFKPIEYKVLNESVTALETEMLSAVPAKDGKSMEMQKRKVIAIPYYTWANRGANSMQVWLPTKIKAIKINYASRLEDGGNY